MPPAKSRAAKTVYSVHPGVAMVQGWIDSLPDTTGRSFEQWLTFIRKSGPKDERACIRWLKDEHGLGSNKAGWLAERASGKAMGLAEETAEGYLKMAPVYVDQQYAGKKAALRPLYDQLLAMAFSLGADVKACPCKTIVPLYRNHVFAQLKPSTNTRLDLGLALAKLPESRIPKRLIDTGGREKKDRITHRIPIESPADIDDFVEKWLAKAYELDEK